MSKINHSIVNFCEGISSGRISEWYCRVYLYVGSLGNKGQMVGMANVLEIFRGSHKLRNCISNFKFQNCLGVYRLKKILLSTPLLSVSLSLCPFCLSHTCTLLHSFLFYFFLNVGYPKGHVLCLCPFPHTVLVKILIT